MKIIHNNELLRKTGLILLSLCTFIACTNKQEKDIQNILDLAGENREEIQAVLDHYKAPQDSLKLKAAYYLIKNMSKYGSNDLSEIYKDAFVAAKNARNRFKENHENYGIRDITLHTRRPFSEAIDSIENQAHFTKKDNFKYDILFVDSDFLISNIDIAFEAYEKNPLKLCKNFNDFLEFVLPYRVGNEPLEPGKRREMFLEYQWALDSLKTKPLDSVIKNIYDDLELSSMISGKIYKYPTTPSLSQTEATRFGDCDYLVTYFISVLRSIGIPAGVDYTPKWGNRHDSAAHSWVFYLTEDHFETINIGTISNKFIKPRILYKYSSVPKVFRRSFSGSEKDVTHFYKKTYDFDVDILWENNVQASDDVYLGIFNHRAGWDRIQEASFIKNDKAHFKNIGSNIIYIVLKEQEGKIIPLNYPFELQKNGRLKFFEPDANKNVDATILRKYLPFYVRWFKTKQKRIRSLNGCILQGSNTNSTKYFKDLYTIRGHNTTHNINIKIDGKPCYRFYRLKGPEKQSINIANFMLLDKNNNHINSWGDLEVLGDDDDSVQKISDSEPLTYIEKSDLLITYSFEKPTCIFGFQVQVRNDDNHIKIGDDYELYYWDKSWKSLNEIRAVDTVLIYKNVPLNALYWLKNHTRGKEEFIFSLDEKGRQFWTGSSEYKNIDVDSLYRSQK